MPLNGSRVAIVLLIAVCLSPIFAQTKTEPSPVLDELLKQYRSLGLPLPPKDAKLVSYQFGFGFKFVERKPGDADAKVTKGWRGGHTVALLIGPAKNQLSRLLLSMSEVDQGGTTEVAPEPHAVEPFMASKTDVADESTPSPANTIEFDKPPVDPFVLAIQCHSLGWTKLAKYLFDASQKGAKVSPRDRLNHLAWKYWKRTAFKPDPNRALVAKHLRELLQQQNDLRTKQNQEFVRYLELAAAPGKAKPGSVEALVDDLINYDEHWYSVPHFAPERVEFDPHDRYWAIVRLGFAAIPTLIEHLEDDRLTQAMMSDAKNTYVGFRVRNVVLRILFGFVQPPRLKSPPRRDFNPKTEALAWWEQARKVSEEAYLLEHVYSVEHPLAARAWERDRPRVNSVMLCVISAKYPKDLSRIYRRVLEGEQADEEWLLPDAVLRSSLRREEKVDLLSPAARQKDPDRYLNAIRAVQKLDQARFCALVLDRIQAFPTEGPFSPPGPEAHLMQLVRECGDPRVWEAARDLAKRAPVGLRIEVLYWIGEKGERGHLREKLQLLKTFLDDMAVRAGSSNFGERFFAASAYPRIEVRDFAALTLAGLVGIDIPENARRSKEEWARIRTQVKAAVEAELSRHR